jgi:molecular chaperone GrpE
MNEETPVVPPDEPPVVPPETEQKLAELSILKASLDDAKKQSAEYYDQLLRLKAEFENYRRRTEKEKVDARLWGKQDVIVPLLGLVDVFEQAMAQTRGAKELGVVVQGLEFLHKNFGAFLKAEGLEPINLMGKPFDPHLAEAVEQTEVDEAQAGTVIGEVQRGYLFQGRVIRPSRVRVGVAKKDQPA